MMYQFSKRQRSIYDLLTVYALSNDPVANARVVSALTLGNRVISFGRNSYKTHPLQKKYGKNAQAIHLHSEIDAIKNALKMVEMDVLRHCVLHVIRVKRCSPNGRFIWGMAKPCLGCQRAIAAFEIRKVFYSAEPNLIKEL